MTERKEKQYHIFPMENSRHLNRFPFEISMFYPSMLFVFFCSASRAELSKMESVIQSLGIEPALQKEIAELETEYALVGEEVEQV
jgi:hypothetical protein